MATDDRDQPAEPAEGVRDDMPAGPPASQMDNGQMDNGRPSADGGLTGGAGQRGQHQGS